MANLTFLTTAFVIFYSWSQVSCDPFDVTSADEVVKYTNILMDLVHRYSKKVSGLEPKNVKKTLKELIEKNMVFESDLKDLNEQNSDLPESVYEKIDKLFDYLQAVRKLFEEFIKVTRVPKGFDEIRKQKFISKSSKVESSRGSRDIKLISLLKSVVPSMISHKEKNHKIPKGSHHLLYNYLKSIVCIEIERYVIKKYGLDYPEMIGEKNASATYVSSKLEKEFRKSVDETIRIFKEIMAITSTKVKKINQINHVEDVTYTQLKFVFQRFLTNEYNIDPNRKCQNSCPAYDGYLGPTNCNDHTQDSCDSFLCQGVLHECKSLPKTLTICAKKDYNQGSTAGHQRYEYLNIGNKRYGILKSDCPSKSEETSTKFVTNHSNHKNCDVCNCICDEQTMRSERFFSLDPVTSDVEHNYVITGARFVKFNRTIFIQIQEGQLMPFGEIDSNTVRWVEINKNPKETYKLDWNRGREIGLNSAVAHGGYVLTKLFLYVDQEKKSHKRLQLGAYAHSLDFRFGKLGKSSIFVALVQPEDLKTSEKKIQNTAPKVHKDKYVRFNVSDFQKDLGQSTIPLIDIQNVTTFEPAPLSGIGIHLSRGKNTEVVGFLSLKLFTLVYDSYLELSSQNQI